MTRHADYVVVGSGSAGAVIARRLADAGASVILVEAGKKNNMALVRMPGMMGPMHAVAGLKKTIDWGHTTIPQKHALGRKIHQTHGRVLGGSSSVNGMLFVRGNQKNYDDWAAAGNTGWSFDDVLPYFKKLESFEDGASDLRGGSGPVKVIRARDLTHASESFMDALSATAGVKRNDDYNGAEQEGVGPFQQSNHRGVRYNTTVAYLRDAPPNLTVLTRTQVLRVVTAQGRATGVEILTKQGSETIRADREVIVSAGVFGSPVLLNHSGIGHARDLRRLDIDVVADLPVGDNLHDHLFVPMTYSMPSAEHLAVPAYFMKNLARERLRPDSTFMARSPFEVVGFCRTPYADDIPDMQLHALPMSYPAPNQDDGHMDPVAACQALTVLSTLIYPKSRGTVRLASRDPLAAPFIDPNYLAEPADMDVLVAGMELIRETMGSSGIAREVNVELAPGRAFSGRDALAREVLNRASTVYHPVGTCRMGVDDDAVVDPQLRVRGVDNLRVADASIMPSVTGGNTNAPTLMIGERAADLILADMSA